MSYVRIDKNWKRLVDAYPTKKVGPRRYEVTTDKGKYIIEQFSPRRWDTMDADGNDIGELSSTTLFEAKMSLATSLNAKPPGWQNLKKEAGNQPVNRVAIARELLKLAKGLMSYGDYYIVVTLDHSLLMGDADEILSDVKRHAKDAKIADVDDRDDRAEIEIGSDDEKGLEAAARHLAQTDKVSKVLSRK